MTITDGFSYMTEHEQMAAMDERLREQERWSANHDGKIEAKWQAQDKHNEVCNTELKELREMIVEKFGAVFKKLSALEAKVAIFASLAAAAGAAGAKYLLP